MPELQASSFNQVHVTLADGTSFAGVRGTSTGTGKGTITNSFNAVVQVIKDAGRGAGTFRVRRGFLAFDTSGISGTVNSATLSLTVSHASPDLPKMAVVRGTADGSSTAHFDSITGYNSSATMSGNVTDLAAVPAHDFSSNSSNDTVTISLNSTARGLMTSQDELYIVLVSYAHDYLLVEPTSGGFFDVGLYGTTHSTTSRRPHIDYTEVAAGYTHLPLNVAAADINQVNNVASADIHSIIDV